ncbi:hypothetical protein SEA_FOZZIE_66 [Mycobacterium phage Fozzie]|uniref:Uncharacterized protein n=1 Tax=Mycobacterium phage OSmaximus TaxID=1035482 RepID=G1DJ39_9CAUD|nr:hypothetical protein AVU74_gp067 [Mycobacterium phage OSmaximus]AEJ92826.1 hypothetical protein SEA_OSMAXIMUS_67 [Mycobacterium phage OSmaximus]WNM70061.1 hypothetical protein SEA_FOZZIE_66 [Mycobacterium phage Fozzie]
MATTRKRRGTNLSKTVRPDTLGEFSIAVDEYFGREVGLYETVVNLAAVRFDIARLSERRSQLFDEIKARHARGQRLANLGGGGGRVYLYESVARRAPKRSVPSAVIKKADPKLWEAAKDWAPFVRAGAPKSIIDNGELPHGSYRLPPPPHVRDDLDTIVQRYRSEVFDEIRRLGQRESEIVDALNKIRDTTDWDGSPILFADGWEVATRRWQYSSDKLKEIAPGIWDRLAQESGGGVSKTVRMIDVELAIQHGMIELSDICD